ncbi:MAG: hypothetical protein V3575_01450, partial [Candidatus Absconditabacteria bacterium]
MNRQSLDSVSLQNKFRSTYELFFQTHKLVVSSNFLFPWSPIGVGHRSRYIRIKSKLPLKMYLGINTVESENIIINNVINYNTHDDKYDLIEFSNIHKKHIQILSFIKQELSKYGFEKGLEMTILTEGTRGHGLGFTGCFGACFALSFYILIGKLNPSDLDNYDKFTKSEIFNEVMLLARKIDFISRDGNSSGDNSYFSFLNTRLPMISFCESFNRDTTLELLNNVKSKCIPFDEFFDNALVCNELPLDYALVFSGMKNDSSKIEQFTIADEYRINNVDKFVNESFYNLLQDFDNNHFLKDNYKDSTYDVFVECFSRLNLQLLEKFKNLYNDGFSTSASNEFISQINKFSSFLSLIECGNKFGKDFQFYYKKLNFDGKIGIMPIYSGKIGGGYIIVMKYMQDRDNFVDVLEKLKNDYPNLCIDYASWLDNDNHDGVKILQNISYGQYSEFLSKESVVCKSNTGTIQIGDHLELQNKFSSGLLLDNIEKKIYINGRKLTSDDLCSQSSTVELMTYLIKNIDKSIKNSELPASSYSKNKNDM